MSVLHALTSDVSACCMYRQMMCQRATCTDKWRVSVLHLPPSDVSACYIHWQVMCQRAAFTAKWCVSVLHALTSDVSACCIYRQMMCQRATCTDKWCVRVLHMPCLLWGNVEKFGRASEVTDDNIMKRMRFACWITKTTNTNSEYMIIIAFPRP
jgi:hypothetical protein